MYKQMSPVEDLLVESFGTAVRCAVCGCENVHQLGAEVFERQEDAEHGVHVFVNGQEYGMCNIKPGLWITIDSDVLTNNPSSRRQGLIIPFFCESCSGDHPEGPHFSWLIYQHKGTTFIETETHI